MRITQHSKSPFFKDSDVIINGERLGPAAFESERNWPNGPLTTKDVHQIVVIQIATPYGLSWIINARHAGWNG